MPVSKKRKKDGKPVHRKVAAPAPEGGEHPHGPDAPPGGPTSGPTRPAGKPTNPFVAQQRRASQRGR